MFKGYQHCITVSKIGAKNNFNENGNTTKEKAPKSAKVAPFSAKTMLIVPINNPNGIPFSNIN